MEPTFTKTNRSIVMMRCLGSGCNVFFVSGSNVVFQTLDLAAGRCNEGRLCRMNLVELIEMAGTIRMTPEQGIPRLERRETWGTRGAGLPTATSRLRMIPSLGR